MKVSPSVGAVLTAFAIVALAPGGARTDSPTAFVKKTFWSPDRRFFAVTEPEDYITTVYRSMPGKVDEKIWSMYGWFAYVDLADDGEHLVDNRWGSLLPLKYDKRRIVLYFFKRGELINVARLDQIIQDFTRLWRSESHYVWGSSKGIDHDGSYVVETVEGRTIQFDITTGRVVKTTKSEKPPVRPDQLDP